MEKTGSHVSPSGHQGLSTWACNYVCRYEPEHTTRIIIDCLCEQSERLSVTRLHITHAMLVSHSLANERAKIEYRSHNNADNLDKTLKCSPESHILLY